MFSETLNTRLEAKISKLRQEMRAAEDALTNMGRQLDNGVDYPMLTGSRGTFANLMTYAAEVETLAEAITDMARK